MAGLGYLTPAWISSESTGVVMPSTGSAPGPTRPKDATPAEGAASDAAGDTADRTRVRDVRDALTEGVEIVELRVVEPPPTADEPTRVEWQVTLRGPYLGTRASLHRLLGRLDGLTLRQLTMRATAEPSQTETVFTAVEWLAPRRAEVSPP